MNSLSPMVKMTRSLLSPCLRAGLSGFALMAALTTPLCAHAAPVVSYVAVDVADTVVGQDAWRYDYTVSGSLGLFESINLIFDPNSYSNLMVVSADSVWLTSATDGLPGLPADGLVAATALTALNAPAQGLFSVEFSWSGAGNPSGQSYEWQDESFSLLGTFQTQSPGVIGQIPEPASSVLAFAALAALGLSRIRSCQR